MPDPAAVTASALLEVDDFRVHFRTPRGLLRAVDGVSFRVERGETVGIVGESGCGKTVLGRSILGLVRGKNVVRQGRVLFEGRDISRLSPRRARQIRGTDVAMVFQDPMTSLNPVMKLGPQLTEGLRRHTGLNAKARRELAVELLRSVGISTPERRLGQYPFELSGGMRQRVTIAIAIACNPRLLIADEPTTALDVTVQAQILDLLEQEKRERDMGMVLVSHDLGVVANRTDQILVMYAGKVVERAPTARLFAEMRMPYTEALLRSIPRLEEPSHTALVAVGGRPPDMTQLPAGCRFAARCPYAQARCFTEEPPLRSDNTVGPQHAFACWYPVGTAEGRAALARNQERHDGAAVPAATP